MAKRKIYREGDWFLVPLDRLPGEYAMGLLARASKSGILAGYFFGPGLKGIPSERKWRQRAETLKSVDAILVKRFSDLGLQGEGWPVLGRSSTWEMEREIWRLPEFGYCDPIDKTLGFLRSYAADDPSRFAGEVRCSAAEARRHFSDGSAGHIALQIAVTRVLRIQDEQSIVVSLPEM